MLLNSIFYVVAVYIMDSGLPRADEIISLNEAEALMQANLSSEFNEVVNKIGTTLNEKITKLFEDGMRQHYINEITNFIKTELIDTETTKQINKILALQTPAFQYKNEGKSGQSSAPIGRTPQPDSSKTKPEIIGRKIPTDSPKTKPEIIGRTPQPDSSKTQPTIFGRKIPTDSPKTKPEIIGRGRTSSSTRKRAKKGKRFNKTQKQHGGDYVDLGLSIFTGVIKGPMKRLEKVVTDKLSTYHIENAIGTGFYRAMGQAVFDENTLNCAVDKMLKEELKTSEPDELNTCNPSKNEYNNYKDFKNALIQARCPNR